MQKPPEMISGNMTAGWSSFIYMNVAIEVKIVILPLTYWCSDVRLFWIIHEVCMDGEAS